MYEGIEALTGSVMSQGKRAQQSREAIRSNQGRENIPILDFLLIIAG